MERLLRIFAIIGAIGMLVGAFLLGRATRVVEPIAIDIERDTLYIIDTIREYYPKEVVMWRERTEVVYLPKRDTIRDSIFVEVEVPITAKEYKGRDYRAVVEGYNPILREIEIFPTTQYITTTETIKQRKRWGVSIGIQGGYGITPKGYQPYAGVGVNIGYTF